MLREWISQKFAKTVLDLGIKEIRICIVFEPEYITAILHTNWNL